VFFFDININFKSFFGYLYIMKITISEKQLSMITKKYGDLDEQSDSAESGASGPEGSTTTGAKKWESGVTRGPANQVGVTKWSDIVGSKISRGKANPLM
jgi:hypothetical protein